MDGERHNLETFVSLSYLFTPRRAFKFRVSQATPTRSRCFAETTRADNQLRAIYGFVIGSPALHISSAVRPVTENGARWGRSHGSALVWKACY